MNIKRYVSLVNDCNFDAKENKINETTKFFYKNLMFSGTQKGEKTVFLQKNVNFSYLLR